jgi:hypothetical protein
MELRKFKVRLMPSTIGLIISIALMILFAAAGPGIKITNPYLIGLTALAILLLLSVFYGYYVICTNTEVYVVRNFFFKQKLSYEHIDNVYFHPVWRFGNNPRALSITAGKYGSPGFISIKLMSSQFFSKSDVQEVILIIRGKNPNVILDRFSDELISS